MLGADSIMTLAVAKAIMEAERVKAPSFGGWERDRDYYSLVEKLAVKYMQEIGRKYPHCGYGDMFEQWVFSDNPEPYNSFGNGAAMRISPAGSAARTEREASRLSEAITGVTHNHEEGMKGAEAVAIAVFLARRGFTKKEIRHKIRCSYYPLDFTIDEIRETYSFNETCQETVPQAIEAFLESVSFEDAIHTAVSLGGDSDTLAAITGSLAEAYYGVPDDLKEKALSFLDDDLRAIYEEWTDFTGSENTNGQFKVLTKYISKISDAGTPAHPIQMPFDNFNELVDSFVDEFYQFSERHPEYQLANYHSILESNGLQGGSEKIRNADVDSLDAKCILALIMGAIRGERCCEGTLFGFFRDGFISKWLKRLKSIDDKQVLTQISEIYFEIGGFGKYDTYQMVFDHQAALLITTLWDHPPVKKQFSPEETEKLLDTFKALHVEYWSSEYMDPFICDGTQWELAVKYQGQRGTVWVGSNAYPHNWDELLFFFGIDAVDDTDKVNLKKLTIEFDCTNHVNAKGFEQGLNWHYTESLMIDHEKEQLVLKQHIGTDCMVTHQYDVQGGMDAILLKAETCLNHAGWIDTAKFEDTTGVCFYNLAAEYYDGSTVSHVGMYNRRNIPEKPWSELIDFIREFIGFYGFGELLNLNAFMNAGKDGEVKYCSVMFEAGGRTYYYQTDDDSIQIGDFVMVPFGKNNTERTAYVKNIAYFQVDKVPFPLEKTKKIIGMAQFED